MLRSTFRLLIAVTLLPLAAGAALAQVGGGQRGASISGQIHGQVRYAQGGGPAFNVQVLLEGYSGGMVDQVLTDRNGKFMFSSLRRTQYTVTVHVPGYQNAQQYVELNTAISQYVTFTLKPDPSQAKPTTTSAGLINANVPLKAQEEFTKGRSALLDNGKPEDGIPHLEKAIKLSPNFLEAHLMLGTAYMDLNQLDKAETTLRRALEINAKKIEPHCALGEVYRQQKKYGEAEKTLLAGLKLDENSWRGHLALGRVYWDMGKIVQAGPHVGKALQIKPDLAEGYLLGGHILLRARQPENALIEFEEYLRLDPNGKYAAKTREVVAKIKKALAERKK